jgi:hypothetical protein
MKILLASAFWFLGVWFVYDFAAFAIGMPRVATPLVAVLVAAGIGLALRARSVDASAATSGRRPAVIERTIITS